MTDREKIGQPELNDLVRALNEAFENAEMSIELNQVLDEDIEVQIKGKG
jgi:hypothetical protein